MNRKIKNEVAFLLVDIASTTDVLLKVRAGDNPNDLNGIVRKLRSVNKTLDNVMRVVIKNQKKRGKLFLSDEQIDKLFDSK